MIELLMAIIATMTTVLHLPLLGVPIVAYIILRLLVNVTINVLVGGE